MATSNTGRKLLIGLLVLCTIFSINVKAQPQDHPPFFHLSYQGHSAWLLGSVHLGRADFYPMSDMIEQAFSQAAALVVEADTDRADAIPLLRQYGMQPVTFSAKQQQVIASFCHDKMHFCAPLSAFSPWLQAVQINLHRYQAMGYSPQYGVDQYFMQRRGQRPLYQLESMAMQYQLLGSLSTQSQWQMLQDAITTPDSEMLALIHDWRQGKDSALTKLIEGDISDPVQYALTDKLLWQRNHTMADSIITLLQQQSNHQPLFIIIGAGHLLGNHSVVQSLRQSGVSVKTLQ
ncbi:protein GumN [Shewanella sp. NFH-SH190041]|uniref:TraB/GumN family protein n=1 Tax=Shewanella sp. NFH-SH190041 TaxID=2950245 RepID=UPI0021C25F00|nr:TraB/GumN family protein [Shewanella sp. NFH-SH190041]BDM63187.1 protein GumN [Shewanella sp. NFH-SH190041]